MLCKDSGVIKYRNPCSKKKKIQKWCVTGDIPGYYETNWGLEKGILRRAEGSRLCSLWI
jgi:hypothetical protein